MLKYENSFDIVLTEKNDEDVVRPGRFIPGVQGITDLDALDMFRYHLGKIAEERNFDMQVVINTHEWCRCCGSYMGYHKTTAQEYPPYMAQKDFSPTAQDSIQTVDFWCEACGHSTRVVIRGMTPVIE